MDNVENIGHVPSLYDPRAAPRGTVAVAASVLPKENENVVKIKAEGAKP